MAGVKIMKLYNRKITAVLVAAALSGCSSDNSADLKNENAPQLLETAEIANEYSTFQVETPETYLAGAVADPRLQWHFTFNEDEMFDDPNGGFEKVDYYDIDLLAGVTDTDAIQYLDVTEMEILWRGPDCSDALVTAVNYEDYCTPFLEEAGFSVGDNLEWTEKQEVLAIQNLATVWEPLYNGFEFRDNVLRVRPKNFAPILGQDERAELDLRFKVSDGEHSVTRYVKATVMGLNNAPQFLELNEDGTPIVDDTGNTKDKQLDIPEPSEKDLPVTINLLEGIYDKDIMDNYQFGQEVGDLSDFYQVRNAYAEEILSIDSYELTMGAGSSITMADLPDQIKNTGLAGQINQVRNPFTGQLEEANITIDPRLLADLLEKGEFANLTYEIVIKDSDDNLTTRTIVVPIEGANLTNPPELSEEVITKTLASNESEIQEIDLLEKIKDSDGDALTVIEFSGPEGVGINRTDSKLRLDTYQYLYLKPGETETLVFTYKVTDGQYESAERTLNIEITGGTNNLVKKGDFENGVLDNGWIWQWSPGGSDNLVVNQDAAHSGTYGLSVLESSMFIRLKNTGIIQNTIREDDNFYISFSGKTAAPWGRPRIVVNKGDTYDINDPVFNSDDTSSLGVANTWVDRYIDFDAAETEDTEAYFKGTNDISVTILANKDDRFDDFAIVKYKLTGQRNLVPNGNFNEDSLGVAGWTTTGSATISLSDEATSQPGDDDTYGLLVEGGASGGNLVFDSSVLKQGVKQGMRYIVEFKFKSPETTGAEALDWSIQEDGGTNFVRNRKFSKGSDTAYETYKVHLDTTSDSVFSDNTVVKSVTSDVDFDWSNANYSLNFNIPANAVYWIDDIKMYPVPKGY